jgi:hypothetical protein
MNAKNQQLAGVRFWVALFIVGLVLSGLTAFPLETEIRLLSAYFPGPSALGNWLRRVQEGIVQTNKHYPFMAYGTDWLAFAHLVIAVAFVGVWIDPVRNKFIVLWGMICCAAVVPLALIAGQVRGIPWGWRMIDCAFGVVGILPLLLMWRAIAKLETVAGFSGAHARKEGDIL